jgi:hypothetical protein
VDALMANPPYEERAEEDKYASVALHRDALSEHPAV